MMSETIESIMVECIHIGRDGFSGQESIYGIFEASRRIRELIKERGIENGDI